MKLILSLIVSLATLSSAATLQMAYIPVTAPLDGADQVKFICTVTQQGDDVLLEITNTGTEGILTGVYLDIPDEAFVLLSSPGTAFDLGGSPVELPGANTINWTSSWLASSESPAISNGLAQGEFLQILVQNAQEADVQVGLKVQSIGVDNVSAALVTVPEPSAALLGGLGLLALIRRRR